MPRFRLYSSLAFWLPLSLPCRFSVVGVSCFTMLTISDVVGSVIIKPWRANQPSFFYLSTVWTVASSSPLYYLYGATATLPMPTPWVFLSLNRWEFGQKLQKLFPITVRDSFPSSSCSPSSHYYLLPQCNGITHSNV